MSTEDDLIAFMQAQMDGDREDQIVRWQDVEVGDLVLLNDELTLAVQVDVYQDTWGPSETFTRVDIFHVLGNGHRVMNERHGDRYAAVRRCKEASQ